MDTLLSKEKLIAQDRTIEWLGSCLMLAWAITLMLPGNTLDIPAFSGFRFTDNVTVAELA